MVTAGVFSGFSVLFITVCLTCRTVVIGNDFFYLGNIFGIVDFYLEQSFHIIRSYLSLLSSQIGIHNYHGRIHGCAPLARLNATTRNDGGELFFSSDSAARYAATAAVIAAAS